MDNLTPRAQQALALARKISGNLRHNYVGCEHLTAAILTLCPLYKDIVDLQGYFNEFERGPDNGIPITWQPYTPRVKKVLALAGKAAKQFGHAYVSCDHILLASLREREGFDKKIMKKLGVDLDKLEKDIVLSATGIAADEESDCKITMNPIKGDALKSVESDTLQLKDWDAVIGKTIKSVKSVTTTEGYSEYMAGGIAGGQSKTNKLIITFTDGSSIEHIER